MASLFKRKKKFVINEPDPEYQVVYLGNVLTSMAKGDVEKPLSLIWRTYMSRTRPDLQMVLTISNDGLKAQTKQQGLTEYWAHRITWCLAPSHYPKIFCWVYKHEGKKMKPELRCHAALCKKAAQPQSMVLTLQNRITAALIDYKREKVTRQNLRLSSSVLGYRSVPMRRLMLSTSGHNFRPPMTRSKSAPRLHSINEEEGDDDQSEEDEVNGGEVSDDVIVGNGHLVNDPLTSNGHLILNGHLTANGHLVMPSPPKNGIISNGVSYFAQLSTDSAFTEHDLDDNATVQDDTGGMTPRSPGYISSYRPSSDYRRNSTFSFMQIVEPPEDVVEDDESSASSSSLKKLTISRSSNNNNHKNDGGDCAFVEEFSGRKKCKDLAEDSISDESGYHEEKISSSSSSSAAEEYNKDSMHKNNEQEEQDEEDEVVTTF